MRQSAKRQVLLPQNPRLLSPPGAQARFTAERVLRTRPKTYRAIVQLLVDPAATVMHIAKRHRVSEHTVRAITLSGEPSLTIDQDHYFPRTDDELLDFVLYLSEKRKVIDAEIVTDDSVGHAGDPSVGEENPAQKER